MRARFPSATPALLVALQACSHQAVPIADPDAAASRGAPAASAAAVSAVGAVSFEVLVDPSAPKPRLGEHEEFIQPELRSAPLPTSARIDTVRDAPPNQGYDAPTILVKWRPVPVNVDLIFRFSIVDGKGGVELAPRK